MKADQLLEVVDLTKLLLKDCPLALYHGNRYVFIDSPQEILHLLPKELYLAQLFEVSR